MTKQKKRKIDWGKAALMIFSFLMIIIIFKIFLIPMVLSMANILQNLIILYKLLAMPYLFFGSLCFLFIIWYFFTMVCKITYWLFEFVVTTNIIMKEKK